MQEFTPTINRLTTMVTNNYDSAKKYMDRQYVFMHTMISKYLFIIFLYYGMISAITQDTSKQLYTKYDIIKLVVDYSRYYIDYVYSFIISKKIEPMCSYWISSSILTRKPYNRYEGEEYRIIETYDFFNNPLLEGVERKECCINNFNEICHTVDTVVLNSEKYIQGLVRMKFGENYVYRIFDNNNGSFNDFTLPLVSSKANFLSIEYVHPFMNESIFIQLDRSTYFADNQILSCAFVKLYLEYQSKNYYYDKDYKLKIIDNDINTFEIGFDKAILLTECGYKVI
jgi:hypothetical protein